MNVTEANMALCVICNPTAGRGAVRRRLNRVRQLLRPHADFRYSRELGQAEALAYEAVLQGYATVVAAGGDGTVHEVANGVLRAGRSDVAFGVIPLGSGNDYAHALGLPSEEVVICERLRSGPVHYVDVGAVRDDRGRMRYFVNTLGLGLSGAVAVEARKIRWLRGLPLYGLAALRAIGQHFDSPDTVLTVDNQRWEVPTLYLAVALGQREGGGFVIAPDARLDDGLFDYLHASRMTRWQALRYLPRLVQGRLPEHDPAIRRGRGRMLSLQSAAPVPIHLDGELFARPKDEVRGVQVWLLPAQLRVCGASHPRRGGSE